MHERRSLRLLSLVALVTPAFLAGCTNTHSVSSPTPRTTTTDIGSGSSAQTKPSAATYYTRTCPAKVLSPAKFQQQKKKELIYQGGFRYENIPANIAWGETRIQTEPARHAREITPAEYRTVTETVETLRERYELRTTPAQYTTETKRVKTKDASLRWRPGCQGKAEQCAMPVPAEYTYVKRQLLAVPATTKRVYLPSETVQVKRKVLVKPGTGSGGIIPAQYRTVKVGRVISPWQVKTVQDANRYHTIDKQTLIHPQRILTRHAVCDEQMQPGHIQQLQTTLQQAGIAVSITGKMDAQTHTAITHYQEKHQLASGALTIETLEHLGLR